MNFDQKKIELGVFSSADSVAGQGVGSAYKEQVNLLKEGASDLLNVHVNEKGKFDLQHFHTIDPLFYLKMNRKAANIAYCHFLPDTLEGSLRIPRIFFPVASWYIVHFYNRADWLVVVNPSFIEPLASYGIPREKIVYIPNFVSKEKFHDLGQEKRIEERKKWGIDPDAFVVLGCGQVQTRKGVKEFVEVARALPHLQFVWAGGFSFGALTDGYDELKKLMENPPENVVFTDIIEREKMAEIYNMCDLLFIPSYAELFPMTILEASNMNKPILTRDLELYEGILFDHYLKASDNEGFIEWIRKLSEDPEFYREQARHSGLISEFYSKEHVLQLWRDFYRKVYDRKFSGH